MSDPKTILVGRSRLVAAKVYFLDKQGREVRPIFQKDRETGVHSYRVYLDGGNEKATDIEVYSHEDLIQYAQKGHSIRCLLPDGQSSNRSLGSHDIAELVVLDDSASQSYWWVNHKQTFTAEFAGGYIWSPKVNKNGARNQTYDNLTIVQPGDVVVSYAGAQIQAIGIATARCRESAKPEEFGQAGANWSNLGWLVSIDWTALPKPVSPKAHIERIRPLLPEKHSPLQANGNGNQSCYLAAISPELGRLILDLAEQGSPDAVQAIEVLEQEVQADAEEQAIQSAEDIPETEKEQLVRSRRGQGLFRQRVLVLEPRCRLTGVDDQSFLIASHIKPWKDCNNSERLDGYNGLMVAPHVDRLFDRGWISFTDEGQLMVAAYALPILEAWGIKAAAAVGSFSDAQKGYLAYHREEVFKG